MDSLEEISTREQVHQLVTAFYTKVRKNETLGPIFNPIIKDWPRHLEHITNFWTSNLFFERTYYGNPLEKHIGVDQYHQGKIEALHFGIWLNLWFQTIDEYYSGENAHILKNRARSMGTMIHINMVNARNHDPREK